MSLSPKNAPVTQKQFFISLSLIWLYIFILSGMAMAEDPSPSGIILFVSAFLIYLGQAIAFVKSAKAK